jgi:hypothetical protein
MRASSIALVARICFRPAAATGGGGVKASWASLVDDERVPRPWWTRQIILGEDHLGTFRRVQEELCVDVLAGQLDPCRRPLAHERQSAERRERPDPHALFPVAATTATTARAQHWAGRHSSSTRCLKGDRPVRASRAHPSSGHRVSADSMISTLHVIRAALPAIVRV